MVHLVPVAFLFHIGTGNRPDLSQKDTSCLRPNSTLVQTGDTRADPIQALTPLHSVAIRFARRWLVRCPGFFA